MAETITLISAEASENKETDLETFRSRLKKLEESREYDSSENSDSDSKKIIEDFASKFQERMKEVEAEERILSTLNPEDLDAYMEQLKTEISIAVEENRNISEEISDISRALAGDSNQLDGDLEKLAFSLELIDSQGLHYFQAYGMNGGSTFGDTNERPVDVSDDQNFEILKLQQHIEKSTNDLNTLQDLDSVFKRVEAIGQIEDKISSIKILGFEGNCIRVSMRTDMPSSDVLLYRHKLDCLIDPSVVDHELLIEVVDKTLELHKIEIFPNDISLDGILHTVKSSSHIPITMSRSTLQYLVREVQYRIIVCTLRRLLVKDANKSRHTLEYSDRDDTITAHLVGGIDAFIKIPQGWPIANYALKLLSIKNSDIHSKSISLTFFCKTKELANSLNIQTRGHIVQFVDAIEEILIKEMHSELQSNDS